MDIQRLRALFAATLAAVGIFTTLNPALVYAQDLDATVQADASAAAPSPPRTPTQVLADQVAQARRQRDAAQAEVTRAQESVERLTRERNAAQAAVEAARAQFANADRAVTVTAHDCVTVVTGNNVTATTNCGTRLAESQRRLSSAQAALNRALAALRTVVTAIIQVQEGQGARLTSLEAAERELREAVTRAQATADHADREAARAHTRIDGVERRVDNVEREVREVRTQVGTLGQRVQTNTADIRDVRRRLGRTALYVGGYVEGMHLDGITVGGGIAGGWRHGVVSILGAVGASTEGVFLFRGGVGGVMELNDAQRPMLLVIGGEFGGYQLPEPVVGERSGRVLQSAGSLGWSIGPSVTFLSAATGPSFIGTFTVSYFDAPGTDTGIAASLRVGFVWGGAL